MLGLIRIPNTMAAFMTAGAFLLTVYDLVYHWFVKNQIKVRSLEELGKDLGGYDTQMRMGMETIMPSDKWHTLASLPAPLIMICLSLLLYLLYRTLCVIFRITPDELRRHGGRRKRGH